MRAASVQLRFEAGTLTLDVQDRGTGFVHGDAARGLELVTIA